DVALHVVERGPAQPRLAAIRLVAADLEGQACNAVEQALRGKMDMSNLRMQIRQVSDQRIGFVTDIGAIGPEQLGFDPVKTMACVRPRIDLMIELGHETAREDLGALPSNTGLDPGPPGTIEIIGDEALTQRSRAVQRAPDVFDERTSIA